MVILAVSVDSDKAKVAPFVEGGGYSFRVALGDGAIEGPYDTAAIPQTYVIDAEGVIRFHETGFRTRYFQESMDWMIEVAREPVDER